MASFSSFSTLLEKYDYFLFDCDGVLWELEKDIPGSFETLNRIKAAGKRCFFVTNHSGKTSEDVVAKLSKFGFQAEAAHCPVTGSASAQFLDTKDLASKKVLVIGEEGLCRALANAGYEPFRLDDSDFKDFNEGTFKSMQVEENVAAVVCGIFNGLKYYHLCYASLCVRKGSLLLGTNEDGVFKIGKSLLPGAGITVRLVEEASEVKATMIGKPQSALFDMIIKQNGLEGEPRSKFLMVGDNPKTDIAMGNRVGIDTLLVLSGVTNEEQAAKLSVTEQRPTYVQPYLGYST